MCFRHSGLDPESHYILKTKNFILNHADITPIYKARIKKYYLSPEEIMELVNNQEVVPPV